MRIDSYIASQYWFTRNRVQQLIDVGLVLVNGQICKKASSLVRDTDVIEITEDRRIQWVSRSAEKLAGFIEQYEIQDPTFTLQDSHCLDIGSSTGGFTQVLLQYWASHIDAVDVGTDQLHSSLRSHSRVSLYEQTDIRDFAQTTRGSYDTIVCDISFISLAMILDSIILLSHAQTHIILLYKPQFEVWKMHLRKTWVPKNAKIIASKMQEFEDILMLKNMDILAKEQSTLKGEAGNQEWIYIIKMKSEAFQNRI